MCAGDARADVALLLDGVLAVAIDAGRRVMNAGRDGLPVNAPRVGLADVFVALPAGRRDGLPVELRLRIRGAVEVVGAVAIGADGCGGDPPGVRSAVDGLLVTHHHAGLAEIVLLHLLRIAMAAPAGRRNVSPGDGRLGVARVQQRVRVAVAILAGRRLQDALVHRLAVVALRVDLRLHAVAVAAQHRVVAEAVLVRQGRDLGVTAGAQVLPVNGGRVGRLVHEQGDRLPVIPGPGQILVAVTSKAVAVIEGERCRRETKRNEEAARKDKSPHTCLRF